MKTETFENYLQDQFMKREPQVLDDDLSDAFDAWLADLDIDDLLMYGEEFAQKRVNEALLAKEAA